MFPGNGYLPTPGSGLPAAENGMKIEIIRQYRLLQQTEFLQKLRVHLPDKHRIRRPGLYRPGLQQMQVTFYPES
jgi:hypothetical protein